MVDLEPIFSFISSVGFPIVCCVFMWRFINTTLADFTRTMNENTKMIAKLCERLEMRHKQQE